MRHIKKAVFSAIATVVLVLSTFAGVAVAGNCYPPPPPGNANCNAGNGNGSEGCDPGNSAAHNRGGDEVPPGIPNPGGNNVP
jgi:hypothetical protein